MHKYLSAFALALLGTSGDAPNETPPAKQLFTFVSREDGLYSVIEVKGQAIPDRPGYFETDFNLRPRLRCFESESAAWAAAEEDLFGRREYLTRQLAELNRAAKDLGGRLGKSYLDTTVPTFLRGLSDPVNRPRGSSSGGVR